MEHGPSTFFFFLAPFSNHSLNLNAHQIGGRFLVGIGVGLAACIAPLYIQELSPTRQRGRMVVLKYVTTSILSYVRLIVLLAWS